MLLFVLFSTLLNLSIGYALGSGFKLPKGLPKIPLLRKKKKLDELDEEEALTRPPEAGDDASVDTIAEEDLELSLPPTVTIGAPKQSQPSAEKATEAVVAAVVMPEPVAESHPSDEPVVPADLLAGLSNLQSQLAEVGEELKSHENDPTEFDECANRLQVANHDYLEKAHDTIEQLDELGNAGDDTAKKAKEQVSSGCVKAEQTSKKIDALLEGDLDEAARKELLTQSAEMVELAKESCDPNAPDALTEESGLTQDAATVELSVDELFVKIEEAAKQMDKGQSLFVAEAKLDPPKEPISESCLLDGITENLNHLIQETISDKHSYTTNERRLILLAGDSLEEACQRVEQVRQTFELTTFHANSITAQATVTCALSEISSGSSCTEIEKQLLHAVEEAEEIGANRTFHHDGAFATAISPLEMTIEKRVIEI